MKHRYENKLLLNKEYKIFCIVLLSLFLLFLKELIKIIIKIKF